MRRQRWLLQSCYKYRGGQRGCASPKLLAGHMKVVPEIIRRVEVLSKPWVIRWLGGVRASPNALYINHEVSGEVLVLGRNREHRVWVAPLT